MIEQWSFVPFDVGFTLTGHLDRLRLPGAWRQLERSEIGRNRLGQGVRAWVNDATTSDQDHLYLNEQGFGIFVTMPNSWPAAQIEPEAVLDVLEGRRHLHMETIAGQGKLAAQLAEIIQAIRLSCAVKRDRPDIFHDFPYVLSIFFADPFPPGRQVRRTQGLLALLEPSLIDTVDDPEVSSALSRPERLALMTKLRPEAYPELMKDYDLSEDTRAHMSWAGVVILLPLDSPSAENVRQMYRELEVRTQLAWSMAYFARKWCHASQRRSMLSESVAEELRYHITPIVRRAVELSDASVGTRMRVVLEGLDTSSGLSAQILAAQAGLQDLESYVEFLREKQRRRYNRFVEMALFILACVQAVPIFFHTPLVHASHRGIIVLLLGALAALTILVILRRR